MSAEEINDLRKEYVQALNRLTDTITDKFDEYTTRLEKITIKQAEQDRDIAHGKCPKPGACLVVAEDVQRLDARLKPLENAFREAVGERRARLAIMAGISAGAGTLGAVMPYLVNLLKQL
jgi:hypothetical protein